MCAGRLPGDLLFKLVCRGAVVLVGIHVTVEGPQPATNSPGVLMFTHGSNLDPFLIEVSCRSRMPTIMCACYYMGLLLLCAYPYVH